MFNTNWLSEVRRRLQANCHRRPAPGLTIEIQRLEERCLLSPVQLDPDFGNVGRVVTAFPAPENYATAVALQSDGKIIATGGGGGLVRYMANGTLDTTFGIEGRIPTPLFSEVNGVAILPSGKILVTGPVFLPSSRR